VETERFEIGAHQVSQLTLYAGLLTGVGVVLDIVAVGEHGHGPEKLVQWGIGLTIGGVIALWARTAYKGRGVYSVKVRLRNGKSFRLGAPVSSQVMADPAFNGKGEQIIAAWQQARFGAAPGGGAVTAPGVTAPGSASPQEP
jgi:hypothetical protein